jgi:hypothetical protein
MMHNDFHYGNILIDTNIKPSGYFVYEINGISYYIKNTGIIPKIWDFEFSMIYSNKIPDSYPNKFIIGSYHYDRKSHKTILTEEELKEDERQNVPYNYNEVYDLHYFLTSLLDLHISDELYDWIIELYPDELIPEQDSSSSGSYLSTKLSNITFTNSDSELNISDSDNDDNDDNDDNNDNNDNDNSDNDNNNDNNDNDNSDNDNSDNSDSDSDDSDNDTNKNPYLSDDRLINGVETQFNLPKPLSLLKHKFFESLTIKPKDFDKSTAIYFKSGI